MHFLYVRQDKFCQPLQNDFPQRKHAPHAAHTQQHRNTNPPITPTMDHTYAGVPESDVVFSADDAGREVDIILHEVDVVPGVGVIVLEVGGVVPEVVVGVSEVVIGNVIGGVQDTQAASLSRQKRMNPDSHSSKLLSLPVPSQSLTQMFPAPSPKRSAASV